MDECKVFVISNKTKYLKELSYILAIVHSFLLTVYLNRFYSAYKKSRTYVYTKKILNYFKFRYCQKLFFAIPILFDNKILLSFTLHYITYWISFVIWLLFGSLILICSNSLKFFFLNVSLKELSKFVMPLKSSNITTYC